MPQFFPLSPYPFTAEASTTFTATTAVDEALDLTQGISNTTRANVLLVQNAGPETVYFCFDVDNVEPPAGGTRTFPDGNQGILSGAIMTFPIAPGAGGSAIFYTLQNTSTVLLSRGWGN